MAWLVSRSGRFEALVKAQPTLLYRHGFLVDAMKGTRISENELLQAVQAIVLESDGTISVLPAVPAALQR